MLLRQIQYSHIREHVPNSQYKFINTWLLVVISSTINGPLGLLTKTSPALSHLQHRHISSIVSPCHPLSASGNPRPLRALCRIKLFPVTHVLVDTLMLIVKPVCTFLNVSDDLKWTTNTHVTPFSFTFKAQLTISMVLEDLFLFLNVLPVHPYFYPSIFVFTRPNDGWTGLYIKLWSPPHSSPLSSVNYILMFHCSNWAVASQPSLACCQGQTTLDWGHTGGEL